MTKTEKLKICARIFYNDNIDQYEDYREAECEFMSNEPSDQFIDFCIEPYLKQDDGWTVFFRDDGHVGALRLDDGFFEPRTEITEEEWAKEEETHRELFKSDINFLEMLTAMGWKEIK